MLKSIFALSCILLHVCLLLAAMLIYFWHTNCSIASATHCDKQQPQLQPSQHDAHALAQLCDFYLHTAMLLHPLLAAKVQPLMDAVAILGTTLWQMIICCSVVPKKVAVNSTCRQSIQLASVVAAIVTPVAAQSPCNCTCSNFTNMQS